MTAIWQAGRILGDRLDEIDAQVDKIQHLIDHSSRLDPELAAGLATTEPVGSVQRKLDQFQASVETFTRDIRTAYASE